MYGLGKASEMTQYLAALSIGIHHPTFMTSPGPGNPGSGFPSRTLCLGHAFGR